jgi:hypothetical protein
VAIVRSAVDFNPMPLNTVFWVAVLAGGAAANLCRRRGISGWRGFWLGFLSGFVVGLIPNVASRVEGHNLATTVQRSLSEFDPVAAAQLTSVPFGGDESRRILRVETIRALRHAPDEAVVAFDEARLRVITPSSASEIPRCAAAARGDNQGLPDLSLAKGGQLLTAVNSLFLAAGKNVGADPVVDADMVRSKLALILATLPPGVFDDPVKFKGLAEDKQCQVYLDFMKGVHSRPDTEAAPLLRYLSGNAQSQ